MSVKYRAGAILKQVRTLQKQYPDAIYKANDEVFSVCLYSQGRITNGPKTCGCIIGQAIKVVYPDLFKKIVNTHNEWSIASVLKHYKILTTSKQSQLLEHIQCRQDSKYPWGKCSKGMVK